MSQSRPLMRTNRFCAGITFTALLAGAAMAAPAVRQMTLDECVKIALEHNLDLEITRYEPVKAGVSLELARAGYEPVFDATTTHSSARNPGGFDANKVVLPSTTVESDSVNAAVTGLLPSGMSYRLVGDVTDATFSSGALKDDNTSGGVTIGARQPLLKNLWIDQTRYDIKVAKNRVKYSDQVLRYQIMSTISSVENAYFTLVSARESVRVQEEALRLAEKLFEENKKRVEVGALAPLDEKQAEAESAMRRADLIAAKNSLSSAQNALKGLLSNNLPDWQEVTLEPSEPLSLPLQLFNFRDSWYRAGTQRPDLLQARLDVEQTGMFRALQYNQLFPQLDIFGSYGHKGSTINEFPGYFDQIRRGTYPTHAIGAELKIPLGNRAARSHHRLAKIEEEQSRLRLKKLEQNIMLAIDDAIQSAQAAYETVKATEQARSVAKVALDAEERKREIGKSTSFVVLQLQKAYTDAQAAEIRALAAYNKALTALAFNEGTILERRGLKLEIK